MRGSFLIATIIMGSTFLVLPQKARADESQWSYDLFGFSYHEEKKMRDHAHQFNPGIGIRYDISDSWYTEAAHIAKNSVKGTTDAIGIGWHTEVTKFHEHPVKLGLQVMYAKYDYPNHNKKERSGLIPVPTLEYGFTKDVTGIVYLFAAGSHMNKSVIFGGVNIRF